MTTEKNFRHGHRDRVRARFLREGLSAFADYEVLELLLFYAIPRRDTKAQAHALDDTLGSLYSTLTASEAELCCVPGIGERTATFLRSLLPFLDYIAKEERHGEVCFDNHTLARRIFPHVEKNGKDSSLVVFLNNRDEVICVHPIGAGKCLENTDAEELISLAFSYGAASIVTVDYKGEGIPFPSDTAMQGMRQLREELNVVGIYVRDYLVFTDSQYCSLFFLTGDPHFQATSPFFISEDASNIPVFPEEAAKKLREILGFVTSAEKADAFATRMLKKYSTLATLLSLPYETLLAENSENSTEVLYLKILYQLHSRAAFSRVRTERAVYKTAHAIGQMLSDTIGLNSEEHIALAMFDKDFRMIDVVICAKGSVNTASFVMRNLVETAHMYKAAYIAIGHNHPGGTPLPSKVDKLSTAELCLAFRRTKIAFMDQFVVTPTGYACVSRLGHKEYTDMPDEFFDKR